MNRIRYFKRKKLYYFIVSVLILSMIPSMAFASAPSDVDHHWAEAQIQDWVGKGWINGYADGTFKPNNKISRAEFMSLVNRAFNYSEKAAIDFKDVSPDTWIADAVSKAKAAGYISGYSDGTIKPNQLISRQEAALMISKITGIGSNADGAARFKDAAKIPAWSRGFIGAVTNAQIMGGYPDGSFQAAGYISRAEAVVAINNALKINTKNTAYDKPGVYGPETGLQTVEGNVTVSSNGVTLKNMNIKGKLILAKSIGEGEVTLKNVTVSGDTEILGGGENSIIVIDSNLGKVKVLKENGKIRIVVSGSTKINEVTANSGAKLEEKNLTGKGFEEVIIDAEENDTIILIGSFESVEIDAPGVTVNIPKGTKVNSLTLDKQAKITGTGIVEKAVINANGVVFETAPVTMNTAPNIKPPTVLNTVSSGGGGGGSGSGGSGNAAQKNSDATLKELTVDGTTIAGFTANTYTYNVELPQGTLVVPTVSAVVNNTKSALTITPAQSIPGATTVVVTAENGSKKTYTINFVFDLAFDNILLSAAFDKESYSGTIPVTGGKAPYAFEIITGSLPSGLSLSTDGTISGTPTAAAAPVTFKVKVTDTLGISAERDFSLAVRVANPQRSPGAVSVEKGTAITLTSATEGAKIYYKINGAGAPTASDLLYQAPIPVNEKMRLSVIAIKEGLPAECNSGWVSIDYSVNSTVAHGTYYKSVGTTLDLAIELNGNTLTKINDTHRDLVKNTDYTVGADKITLSQSYMQAQPEGTLILTVTFSAGATAITNVSVLAAPPAPPEPAAFTAYPQAAHITLPNEITVNLTADKTATAYYAVVPESMTGYHTPTPSALQLKEIGTPGEAQPNHYGVVPVLAGGKALLQGQQPGQINIQTTDGFKANQTYTVFVVLEDGEGLLSEVASADFNTLADNTPPVFNQTGNISGVWGKKARSLIINEKIIDYDQKYDLFIWVVKAADAPADTPTPGAIKANDNGKLYKELLSGVEYPITYTGLDPSTEYKVYMVAQDYSGGDADGLYSDVIVNSETTLADNQGPDRAGITDEDCYLFQNEGNTRNKYLEVQLDELLHTGGAPEFYSDLAGKIYVYDYTGDYTYDKTLTGRGDTVTIVNGDTLKITFANPPAEDFQLCITAGALQDTNPEQHANSGQITININVPDITNPASSDITYPKAYTAGISNQSVAFEVCFNEKVAVFWALLPAGAAAPESDSSLIGPAVFNAIKNGSISIDEQQQEVVSITGLNAGTSYDLWITAIDANSNFMTKRKITLETTN